MSARDGSWKAPRTFGDLPGVYTLHFATRCSFCKQDYCNSKGFGGTYKYSTRHYICAPCIEKRRDQVLPKVRKQERWNAQMAAAIAKVDAFEKIAASVKGST